MNLFILYIIMVIKNLHIHPNLSHYVQNNEKINQTNYYDKSKATWHLIHQCVDILHYNSKYIYIFLKSLPGFTSLRSMSSVPVVSLGKYL